MAPTLTGFDPTGLQVCEVGQAIAAMNTSVMFADGVAPLVYSATNLAPGLSIAPATGIITGTPTTVGQFLVEVTVTDANSDFVVGSFTKAVQAEPVLGADEIAIIPAQNWPGSMAGGPVGDDQVPLCYWGGRLKPVYVTAGDAIPPVDASIGFMGDEEIVRYELVGAPYGITIDPSTGIISGTPVDVNSSDNIFCTSSVRVVAYTAVRGFLVKACESNSFPINVLA